jgi:alpha-L-fucosidase
VKYDADAWVQLAKNAGMKYIVITSKHHDGFALFDSKVTDYDVVDATPYGKDLLKPLAEACRKHGHEARILLLAGAGLASSRRAAARGGALGSGAGRQHGRVPQYIAVPQVKEILTNYGDVAVLWVGHADRHERAARRHAPAGS